MSHYLPNGSSMDFTELLEYDEFDDDSSNRSPPPHDSPVGVPLSIELLTAAAGNKVPIEPEDKSGCSSSAEEEGETNSNFVKGSELFLRFDGVASAANCVDTPTAGPSSATNFTGAGIELQYDNEFDADDDDDADHRRFLQFNDTSKSYHSMIENENEQLLLEGIK